MGVAKLFWGGVRWGCGLMEGLCSNSTILYCSCLFVVCCLLFVAGVDDVDVDVVVVGGGGGVVDVAVAVGGGGAVVVIGGTATAV